MVEMASQCMPMVCFLVTICCWVVWTIWHKHPPFRTSDQAKIVWNNRIFYWCLWELGFRMKGMRYTFFREWFISGLKDKIVSQVIMASSQIWLEATKHSKEEQQVILAQSRKLTFVPLPKPNPLSPRDTPLKVQNLTMEETIEHQLKGLFYICDEKYFTGHKCKERDLFMAISTYVYEECVEAPLWPSHLNPLTRPHPLTLPKSNWSFPWMISLGSLLPKPSS